MGESREAGGPLPSGEGQKSEIRETRVSMATVMSPMTQRLENHYGLSCLVEGFRVPALSREQGRNRTGIAILMRLQC